MGCGTHCAAPGPPNLQTGYGAEGPAVFKHDNRHYIFASHLTGQCWRRQHLTVTALLRSTGCHAVLPHPCPAGWAPNPPVLLESTSGGMCWTFWRNLPMPTHGPLAATTYDAQSTFIFDYRWDDGTHTLLWMGDRWNERGPGGVSAASYVGSPLSAFRCQLLPASSRDYSAAVRQRFHCPTHTHAAPTGCPCCCRCGCRCCRTWAPPDSS